ncbi:hypothetical protein ACJZ2D_000675 [Fusarium nematophilum]
MAKKVAVAGGTGGLGRAIVDALVTAGDHEVLVLSRKKGPSQSKTGSFSSRIVHMDYNDIDDIKRVLEENEVGTVISVLNIQVDATSEFNLIKAAEDSKTTCRYIPSIWGARYSERELETLYVAKAKREVLRILNETSLEYSAWYVGCFLDYWVIPHAPSYMPPFPYAIDIVNHHAALPGSGNVPIVMNYTMDIARFVAASLRLSQWEKETYVINDKVTFNELLRAIEEATGAKFDVTYDSLELLQSGKTKALPKTLPSNLFVPRDILEGYMASLGIMIENGQFDLNPLQTINETFPDIKVRKVTEFIAEVWGGVSPRLGF